MKSANRFVVRSYTAVHRLQTFSALEKHAHAIYRFFFLSCKNLKFSTNLGSKITKVVYSVGILYMDMFSDSSYVYTHNVLFEYVKDIKLFRMTFAHLYVAWSCFREPDENLAMQYTKIFEVVKNENFSRKILIFFLLLLKT